VRVLDDLVEQLVHGLEVGTANMPVRLLAVDGEGGEVDHYRAEELGDTRDDVGVDGTLGNGLYFGHGVTPFRLHCVTLTRGVYFWFNGTQHRLFRKQAEATLTEVRLA
jgi:hypothetical protein